MWVGFCSSTARLTSNMWKSINNLSEVLAECIWRTLGWTCHKVPNAVLESMQENVLADNKERREHVGGPNDHSI